MPMCNICEHRHGRGQPHVWATKAKKPDAEYRAKQKDGKS